MDVVRVFVGPDGRGGNLLAIVDAAEVSDPAERQRLAAELGYSETVFIAANGTQADVDIYTPSVPLPFAGHPLVGTAWHLRRVGMPVTELRVPAGVVATWVSESDGLTWIRASAEWTTARQTLMLESAEAVEAYPAPETGDGFLLVWAWSDQGAGGVRARGFPRRGDGILEDEATGAAAIALTAQLGRDLDIRQGAGSQIVTRFHPSGFVDVGGRVTEASG